MTAEEGDEVIAQGWTLGASQQLGIHSWEGESTSSSCSGSVQCGSQSSHFSSHMLAQLLLFGQ